ICSSSSARPASSTRPRAWSRCTAACRSRSIPPRRRSRATARTPSPPRRPPSRPNSSPRFRRHAMFDVITDLPLEHRPPPRLVKHGAVTLSDAELTAILLGCGTTGKNAIALGRELLVGGRNALARRDSKELLAARGVGPAKAARLLAAFELARRLAEQ